MCTPVGIPEIFMGQQKWEVFKSSALRVLRKDFDWTRWVWRTKRAAIVWYCRHVYLLKQKQIFQDHINTSFRAWNDVLAVKTNTPKQIKTFQLNCQTFQISLYDYTWYCVVIVQASSLIVNIVIFTHGLQQIWGVACESNMRNDANLAPHSYSMNSRWYDIVGPTYTLVYIFNTERCSIPHPTGIPSIPNLSTYSIALY